MISPIKSQRQYDLAKRDGDRISEQITALSQKFDTDIAELEMQIAAKKAARDQATSFLREQLEEIAKVMGEWKPEQKSKDEQSVLRPVGEV